MLPVIAAPNGVDLLSLYSIARTHVDIALRSLYSDSVSFLPLRYRIAILVAGLVLWGLFKINLLSAGWNSVVGLVVTAIVYAATGLIRNGDSL